MAENGRAKASARENAVLRAEWARLRTKLGLGARAPGLELEPSALQTKCPAPPPLLGQNSAMEGGRK